MTESDIRKQITFTSIIDEISSQHNFIFSTFRNSLFNFRRKVEKLSFGTVRSHNTMVLHIKLAEISRMIAF